MQIVVVGVSHRNASLDLLERVAVTPDRLDDLLARLRENVAEGFVLSTCNRVEFYARCGHEESGAELLRRMLADHAGLESGIIRDATYVHGHRAAVRHALRVAAGLDSMVFGEAEIQGQVRRALDAARQAGTLGPLLDRLGSAALACGKRVRSESALARRGESVASVGLRILEQRVGPLAHSHVVILGAGETAALVLDCLAGSAPARITIVSRTIERAAALAAAKGTESRPWSDLPVVLGQADVLIGCTSAPVPVVDAKLLATARTSVRCGSLVCLDLGMPRDIDPSVGALPGITLIGVADLEAAEKDARRAGYTTDAVHIERIVAQETERFMAWWRGRGVASTISRLHARAETIGQAELGRLFARFPALSPHARAGVGEAVTRTVAKLLHEPTLALKEDPEGANMALVIERLFALEPPSDGRSQPRAAADSDPLQPLCRQEAI